MFGVDMSDTTAKAPAEPVAPVAPVAPVEPAAEPVAPVAPVEGETPLGEPGLKALQAERKARADAETAAKALQAQLDAIEAEKLSDLQKAQKAAEAAEAAKKAAEDTAARLQVMRELGVTADEETAWEPLLKGAADAEDYRQRANALRALTPKAPEGAPTSSGFSPNPAAGARGTDQPVSPYDQLFKKG